MSLRVTFVNAGGVGGYFGARLAQGGGDVGFAACGAQLAALSERGLRIEKRSRRRPLRARAGERNPAEIGSAIWF